MTPMTLIPFSHFIHTSLLLILMKVMTILQLSHCYCCRPLNLDPKNISLLLHRSSHFHNNKIKIRISSLQEQAINNVLYRLNANISICADFHFAGTDDGNSF